LCGQPEGKGGRSGEENCCVDSLKVRVEGLVKRKCHTLNKQTF